jgi:hypothetical protein
MLKTWTFTNADYLTLCESLNQSEAQNHRCANNESSVRRELDFEGCALHAQEAQ